MTIRIVLAITALLAAPVIAQSAPRTVGPLADARLGSWIDALPGKGTHRYDDFTVKDVSRTCSGYCMRISDGSKRVVVEGGVWRHFGSPEKILAIFAIGSSGSLTLRNVTAVGGKDNRKVKTAFPNVDDVMAAQRTFLNIEGGSFSNSWDAGIDTKATTTLNGTVTLANNGVNLKAWGPLTAQTIVSRDPERGHVSCLRSPVVACNIHIKKLIAYDSNPDGLLVGFQGSNTTVRIDECELHVKPTMRVSWMKNGVTGANLILGPSCVKDGKVVVAPLKPVGVTPVAKIGFDLGVVLQNNGNKDGAGVVTLTTSKTIIDRNAYLKAHGSALTLKKGDQLRSLGGTWYDLVK
jgi:hypothetical protein